MNWFVRYILLPGFFLSISLSMVKGSSKPVKDVRNLNLITIEKGTLSFSPKVILVKPGTTVTWVNQDTQDHFLMFSPAASNAKSNEPDSMINQPLPPGARFQHKIERVGIYTYFCGIHNQMWGLVMVDENVASTR
jgi:plastocyanin